MGVTEEEATSMYYAEQTHDEVAQAIQRLREQLAASSSERFNQLAKQLSSAEAAYGEAFHELTDIIHEAEISLEREATRCRSCGR